jgi:hypothetical protein
MLQWVLMVSTILLASGAVYDPFNPDPEVINISDIAYALGGITRFGGHSNPRISVAEHCIRVARLARPELAGEYSRPFALFRLACLLHDATESLGLCDLPRPIKHQPELAFYCALEDRNARTIEFAFGLPEGILDAPEVKRLDQIELYTEFRDLMPGHAYMSHETQERIKTLAHRDLILNTMGQEEAVGAYLDEYYSILGDCV